VNEVSRLVKTTCTICGEEITLDFGNATYDEAYKLIDKMDRQARECPGFHVELNGWKTYWQLDKAVEEAYTDEEKVNSKRCVALRVKVGNHVQKFHSENYEQEFLTFIQNMKTEYSKQNMSLDQVIEIEEINVVGKTIEKFKQLLSEY
jgi:hypothetical protein